jgi:hypothetical protein
MEAKLHKNQVQRRKFEIFFTTQKKRMTSPFAR